MPIRRRRLALLKFQRAIAFGVERSSDAQPEVICRARVCLGSWYVRLDRSLICRVPGLRVLISIGPRELSAIIEMRPADYVPSYREVIVSPGTLKDNEPQRGVQ